MPAPWHPSWWVSPAINSHENSHSSWSSTANFMYATKRTEPSSLVTTSKTSLLESCIVLSACLGKNLSNHILMCFPRIPDDRLADSSTSQAWRMRLARWILEAATMIFRCKEIHAWTPNFNSLSLSRARALYRLSYTEDLKKHFPSHLWCETHACIVANQRLWRASSSSCKSSLTCDPLPGAR